MPSLILSLLFSVLGGALLFGLVIALRIRRRGTYFACLRSNRWWRENRWWCEVPPEFRKCKE